MKETESNDKKLTPIHWALYNLIEDRTLGNDTKVSQREIYENLKAQGYEVSWNESQNQHNDHCRWLYDLTMDILKSPEVDHIIIHDGCYNCSLGSKDELLRKWWFYYQKGKMAFEIMDALKYKFQQDGQGKLLTNQGNELTDETLAKLYHETFNQKERGDKEGKSKAPPKRIDTSIQKPLKTQKKLEKRKEKAHRLVAKDVYVSTNPKVGRPSSEQIYLPHQCCSKSSANLTTNL